MPGFRILLVALALLVWGTNSGDAATQALDTTRNGLTPDIADCIYSFADENATWTAPDGSKLPAWVYARLKVFF